MTAIRIASLLGLVVLGFVCYLAVRGFSPAIEIFVTAAALVGMIAGGNWLSGRLGLPARGGRRAPAGADRRPPIGAYCPGTELAGRGARRAAGVPAAARAEAASGPEGSPSGTAAPGPPTTPPAAAGR